MGQISDKNSDGVEGDNFHVVGHSRAICVELFCCGFFWDLHVQIIYIESQKEIHLGNDDLLFHFAMRGHLKQVLKSGLGGRFWRHDQGATLKIFVVQSVEGFYKRMGCGIVLGSYRVCILSVGLQKCFAYIGVAEKAVLFVHHVRDFQVGSCCMVAFLRNFLCLGCCAFWNCLKGLRIWWLFVGILGWFRF